MATAIPVIRAASLAPLVKWLELRGRVADKVLARSGVLCDPLTDPERLIPMRAVLALLRDTAETEGCPDLGWRVVTQTSVADLGRLGLLALKERTPAAALRRTSETVAHFCSHQTLDYGEGPGGGTIRVGFSIDMDPAALHQAQLFSVALFRSLCSLTGRPERSFFDVVRIPPHPVAGLAHLSADLGRVAAPSPDAQMLVVIDRDVLRRPLRHHPVQPQAAQPPRPWDRLRGSEADFVQAIRDLVAQAMLDGSPSADLLAQHAGVTVRTLQRRLAAAGTSFRDLVEDARREQAIARIRGGTEPLGAISASLGYASPTSLSRAVRRWTDRTPGAIRRAPPGESER